MKTTVLVLTVATILSGRAAADSLDTTYDMDMAGAAALSFLGVDWGYHPPALLTGAAEVLSAAAQIPDAVLRLTGEPA